MQLSRRTAISAVTLFALLAAGAAQADDYTMSGTLTLIAGTSTTRVIDDTALVTGTPASLMIPVAAFDASGGAFRVFPTVPTVAQVISQFTSSNAAATLVAAGGPSAFDWCPQNVFNCTAPNNASAGFNGLLRYTSGNGFGGSFSTLRSVTGSVSRLVAPNSYVHSDASVMTPWNPGRGFQFTQTQQAGASEVTTVSPVIGPSGSIQTVGSIVPPTTTPVVITTFTTGFPMTTGMIFVQDTQGALPSLFTVTGSDNRDASGHGSITLVAASMANIPTDGERAFPRFTLLTMNLPEPSTGIALSVGIALLLGAARLRRR